MKFKNLIEATSYFSDPQTCKDYLAAHRWKDKPRCVFCDCEKIYVLKGAHKRYKCSKCGKHFSITKGTIFEKSQISLQKWFVAIYILSSHKKGASSIQLANDIGVTQKTAWFMAQRIRFLLKTKSFDKQIEGLVQVDETYMGGKMKNKKAGKKVANAQGRSLKDKTPVFGMIHIGGKVYTSVIPDTKGTTIKPIIEKMIKEGSLIVSDEWWAYHGLNKTYNHVVVKHRNEEYVRGAFHTNTIENFWSLLKRGIYGVYHQVSAKHLHRYCDEFAYRYNTRKVPNNLRFDYSLDNVNCRLTLKELVGK